MNCKPIVALRCPTISEDFPPNNLFLSDEVLMFYNFYSQVKEKVTPLPNSESSLIVPPSEWTIFFDILFRRLLDAGKKPLSLPRLK